MGKVCGSKFRLTSRICEISKTNQTFCLVRTGREFMTLNESFTILQNQLDNVSLFSFGYISETDIYDLSYFMLKLLKKYGMTTHVCVVYMLDKHVHALNLLTINIVRGDFPERVCV